MVSGKIRSIKSSRILIVEDQKNNLLVLQKMIEAIGLPVVTATNGKEAVDRVSENRDISVILMDIKMPVMDGFQTLCEIRKINPHAIVIAETAYALPGDREKIIESGFTDYLSKPFTLESLRNVLNKYIPLE